LSVMYDSNVSGRSSSDLRAVLIVGFIIQVLFRLDREIGKFRAKQPCSRELKETIEQLKILYLPITFGVSEKRLRRLIFDEMRSDTPPRLFVKKA
ncbi:hypothetical protein T12_12321, partial [Trichinella patagoniensis]